MQRVVDALSPSSSSRTDGFRRSDKTTAPSGLAPSTVKEFASQDRPSSPSVIASCRQSNASLQRCQLPRLHAVYGLSMPVDDGRTSFGIWLLDQLQDAEPPWSYRAFAAKVGVHASTVGHWISGRALPESQHAIAVADAIGADRDWVLELAGHRPRVDVDQIIADRGLAWAKRSERFTSAEIALVESLIDQIDRNKEAAGGSRR